MYVRTYVLNYAIMQLCNYVMYEYACMSACMHACMSASVHAYIHACVVHVCMYACMDVCNVGMCAQKLPNKLQ